VYGSRRDFTIFEVVEATLVGTDMLEMLNIQDHIWRGDPLSKRRERCSCEAKSRGLPSPILSYVVRPNLSYVVLEGLPVDGYGGYLSDL
jgi:hypothetical protein